MTMRPDRRELERQEGLRLLIRGKFKFSCHKGVSCFTDCCADLHLILTPYDIIRMKSRLRLSAAQFVKAYTLPDTSTESVFPILRLKMEDNGRRKCPFVEKEGCAIYEDRPGACRLYPVGRAAFLGGTESDAREQHFIVDESHCKGFDEGKEWTVEEWVRDQGVDLYNRMNRPWMEIVTSQNPRKRQLTEDKIQMFYMVSYNPDRFRDFVFKTRFLQVFRLPTEEIEQIKTDETELMGLGMRWLKFALYGENTLTLYQ